MNKTMRQVLMAIVALALVASGAGSALAFNPQPEPPAATFRHRGFNSQSEPPGSNFYHRGFNPQPEPPAINYRRGRFQSRPGPRFGNPGTGFHSAAPVRHFIRRHGR